MTMHENRLKNWKRKFHKNAYLWEINFYKTAFYENDSFITFLAFSRTRPSMLFFLLPIHLFLSLFLSLFSLFPSSPPIHHALSS